MILSQSTLKQLITQGIIAIEPEPQIKEASIKMHLSTLFAQPGKDFIESESYLLKPKEFILAQTSEKITLPANIAGLYDGYTHLARQGVMTHMGSMFVDPESDNHITLEIYNASQEDVLLEGGMRVGHLVFFEVK